MSAKIIKMPSKIFELEISLFGIKPKIWRRIAVPYDIKLSKLHDTIQTVFGWTDSHLHAFKASDGTRYSQPDPYGGDFDDGFCNEKKAKLIDLVTGEKQTFEYEYDFGDSWIHIAKVTKTYAPADKVKYPVCLAGKRACPPEDIGGVWGYEDYCKALKEPDNEQYQDMLEWMGDDFDPEWFDIDRVNRLLR